MGVLLAGAAKENLTPATGLWLYGFGPHPTLPGASRDYEHGYLPRTQPSQGVLDNLHARAIVLKQAHESLALVTLDLLEIPGDFCKSIREDVAAETGIPPRAILINASHTHSGPDWGGQCHPFPREVAGAMRDAVTRAVIAANSRLEEARIGYGIGSCTDVAINRQNPFGPIDPEVCVLRIDRVADGQLLGVAVKYACHPIVLQTENLLYSADYPGVACAALEAVFPGSIACFLQGMSGNINPVAFPQAPKENIYSVAQAATLTGRPSPCTPQTMRAIGHSLAAKTLTVIAGLVVRPTTSLGSAHKSVRLMLKPRADRELFCEFMAIDPSMRSRYLDQESWITEVQVLRIGSVHIVALPGEPYVELGLRLRASRPELNIVPIGYSNDSILYVPMDIATQEHRYENVASVVARGSQISLADAADQLIDSLL